MRALKAVTIGMGILIVAGIAVLVSEIIRRATDPEYAARFDSDASPAAAASGDGPVRIGLDLPEDSEIVAARPSGTMVSVQVRLPGGGERVYLVDSRAGQVVAVIGPNAEAGAVPAE